MDHKFSPTRVLMLVASFLVAGFLAACGVHAAQRKKVDRPQVSKRVKPINLTIRRLPPVDQAPSTGSAQPLVRRLPPVEEETLAIRRLPEVSEETPRYAARWVSADTDKR